MAEREKWLIYYTDEGKASLEGALSALESGDKLQAALLAGFAKSALALAAMYECEPETVRAAGEEDTQ